MAEDGLKSSGLMLLNYYLPAELFIIRYTCLLIRRLTPKAEQGVQALDTALG